MNRREFIRTTAMGLGAAMLPWDTLRTLGVFAAEKRPNIVLIIADDLGYADLGVQGCLDVPTPNIDSIAHNGVRFTNGYVTASVCSPSRAGLMTGHYQQRFGHEFNPGNKENVDYGLVLSETIIPQYLKPVGYATGAFGKWHLGNRPEQHPMGRGFDAYYGFPAGAHAYLTNRANDNRVVRGYTPVTGPIFTTRDFAREAVSFIDQHKHEPFFVYLPFNAVHTPLEVPAEYTARFSNIKDPDRRTFAGMLSALDDAVGTVLAKLRTEGLEENTLVFFFSDNGGPTGANTSSNAPLRGTKATLYEGGIRVPFMMQWPRVLPSNQVYTQPIISLDILPTILAATGVATPTNLDGVNLIPYLTGEKPQPPHEALYWRALPDAAVRMGDWKFLRTDNKDYLYNLAADIGEQHDLAAQEPTKLKELTAAFIEWGKGTMAPRWR